MRFFYKGKDGGPESAATGYWLVELKRAFSIVLLRIDGKGREAYHTHAFHALSWVLPKGLLKEEFRDGRTRYHYPSWLPILTTRQDFHRVDDVSEKGHSWVFSIRGPWSKTWMEHRPLEGTDVELTSGRVEREL